MRLIFVNHAHPKIHHVSGMRLSYFSHAMADRGHQVVLLTCPIGDSDASPAADRLLAALGSHEWHQPFVLAVAPIRRSRSTYTHRSPLIRRTLTLWQFVRFGGVLQDWVGAAEGISKSLVEQFNPDIVWATFGNTSNLVLAQMLARGAKCPWVLDVKDSWEAYLKPGVRELMAWRFRDASAMTSNCRHYEYIASKWLRMTRRRVIYSGVADSFYQAEDESGRRARDLVLVGSTREPVYLRAFLVGVKNWFDRLSTKEKSEFRFVYAGTDHREVQAAMREVDLSCAARIEPYLSISDLAKNCRGAFANAYLWATYGFHHKLLELLVCGRPVISFPGETPEALQLASQVSTSFAPCANHEELQAALRGAWSRRAQGPARGEGEQWRWRSLNLGLEEILSLVKTEWHQ